jgi:predicted lipoprotein with Yx(FWY)xxD motif
MTRRRPHSLLILVVLIPLVALVVAGCGSSGGQATAASSSKNTSSSGSSGSTIGVSNNSKLGNVLVDSQGRTVYLFKKDTSSMSTCSGACATQWPPVISKGKPSAGTGVTASMLSTTTRSDGSKQVTYNGHPLYTYIGDQSAGDVNGQGLNFFGGEWYVVTPAGNANTTSTGSSSSTGY